MLRGTICPLRAPVAPIMALKGKLQRFKRSARKSSELEAEPRPLDWDAVLRLWHGHGKASLWILCYVSLFLLFVGLCGAAHSGIPGASLSWIWWALCLQVPLAAYGGYAHFGHTLPQPCPELCTLLFLAAELSAVVMMIAADRALQLAAMTVRVILVACSASHTNIWPGCTARPDNRTTLRAVQIDELQSYSSLVAAGCILALLAYLPLIADMAVHQAALATMTPSARIELSQQRAAGHGAARDARCVEMGSLTNATNASNSLKYVAYVNPYHEHRAKSDPDAIAPSLQPQVRLCTIDRACVLSCFMISHVRARRSHQLSTCSPRYCRVAIRPRRATCRRLRPLPHLQSARRLTPAAAVRQAERTRPLPRLRSGLLGAWEALAIRLRQRWSQGHRAMWQARRAKFLHAVATTHRSCRMVTQRHRGAARRRCPVQRKAPLSSTRRQLLPPAAARPRNSTAPYSR